MNKKQFVIPIIALAISVTGCSSKTTDLSKEEIETDLSAIINDGKLSDRDSFDKFAKMAENGQKCSIRLSYISNNAESSEVELTYDGEKYIYSVTENSENIEEQYHYLCHFEGTYKNQYTYQDYVLTNDKELTYDALQELIIDSNSEEVDSSAGYRYVSVEHEDLTYKTNPQN